MKPAVPSAVPYPDMRSWQRLGVKLWGKRSRRATGTPSREARRNLPARRRRGARDGWVRPTHVNVRESVVMSDKPNVLTGLNQKVCGKARSFVLWTVMDTIAAGAQDGSAPSGNSCGTG